MSKKDSKASATSRYLRFKNQPPPLRAAAFGTPQAFWQVFAIGALPIQAWAFFNLFREIPALVIRLTAWDMLGVASYIQTLAVVESLGVWLSLIGLAVILPARWFRNQFVVQSAGLIAVNTGWALLGQANLGVILDWQALQWLGWGGVYLLSVGLVIFLLQRSSTLTRLTLRLVERLVLLSAVYVALGGLGVLIVIARNLIGRTH